MSGNRFSDAVYKHYLNLVRGIYLLSEPCKLILKAFFAEWAIRSAPTYHLGCSSTIKTLAKGRLHAAVHAIDRSSTAVFVILICKKG
jgi:hypothetical protein